MIVVTNKTYFICNIPSKKTLFNANIIVNVINHMYIYYFSNMYFSYKRQLNREKNVFFCTKELKKPPRIVMPVIFIFSYPHPLLITDA